MTALTWEHDDGGRWAAGFKGHAGDCGARAASIATGRPYEDVYRLLAKFHSESPLTRWQKKRGFKWERSARNGVTVHAMRRYLIGECGWVWTPTMSIGSGCTVHLAVGEVPMSGPLVVRVSKHFTAVVDGTILDTYDCSRDGTRCVYGYWSPPKEN
jgi:hypothetical protein